MIVKGFKVSVTAVLTCLLNEIVC